MKQLLVIALALVGFAGVASAECAPGTRTFFMEPNANDRTVRNYATCVAGKWHYDNDALNYRVVEPLRCSEGSRTFFLEPKDNDHGSERAYATCTNGKWVYDNARYNYRRVAAQRCVEGRRIILISPTRGGDGSPAYHHRTCVNGRWR